MAMCAALTGCQAMPQQPEPTTEPISAAVPIAVPQTDVLNAVRAASTLHDLPRSITNDELLETIGDYTEHWTVPGCAPSLPESRLDDIGPSILGDTASERTLVLIGDSAASMWHSQPSALLASATAGRQLY